MSKQVMNRAERRAMARQRKDGINPKMLTKAILSLEHPLEERKIWATTLALYHRMNAENTKALLDMVENAEKFQDLKETLDD